MFHACKYIYVTVTAFTHIYIFGVAPVRLLRSSPPVTAAIDISSSNVCVCVCDHVCLDDLQW